MTNKLLDALAQAETVAITGHVNPDGDCVGSCMGMYLYPEGELSRNLGRMYILRM